jgi:transcriptional regulator with XRE-family HTH domain
MRISHTHQSARITWRVRKNVYIDQRNRMINLLREMRAEAGLTQTELAARIEKDQTFVSKYESGERRLDVLEVREICQVIGTTLEEFIKRLEEVLK